MAFGLQYVSAARAAVYTVVVLYQLRYLDLNLALVLLLSVAVRLLRMVTADVIVAAETVILEYQAPAAGAIILVVAKMDVKVTQDDLAWYV
jgi:hypothetical protein